MQQKLTYESLGNLDHGAAKAAINAALRILVNDLDDRGADGKPREAVIKVIIQRIDEGRGKAVTHVECGTKLPSYRTAGTICNVQIQDGSPELLFQDLAPEDADQRTIDERIRERGQ